MQKLRFTFGIGFQSYQISERMQRENGDGKAMETCETFPVGQFSLLPRESKRLLLTIDPDFISKLVADKVIGYQRSLANQLPTSRYYTLNIENIQSALTALVKNYLTVKLYRSEVMCDSLVDAEVNTMTPIIVNACFAALYAKLRTIHELVQTYANRFQPPPTYTRDIELPLPLADAIQNIGVFTPSGIVQNYLCIPVYPENVSNEGRSTQIWEADRYEAYVPQLKSLGIPVKSVDTHLKIGSPWWTYKVELHRGHYDLRCIFSPSNYSDHSCMLASMFLGTTGEPPVVAPIITHVPDDTPDYPVRCRQLPDGYQLRAFAALCHAPREEWSST